METEIDTVIPNPKEEDLETETDGNEAAAIQDRNPKEDTEIIETAVEKEERMKMEEKERAQIGKTGTETRKKEKMTK